MINRNRLLGMEKMVEIQEYYYYFCRVTLMLRENSIQANDYLKKGR